MPPFELSGQKNFQNFFLKFQKTVFFLSGQALTPPPLSGRATKKRPLFLCGFPFDGFLIIINKVRILSLLSILCIQQDSICSQDDKLTIRPCSTTPTSQYNSLVETKRPPPCKSLTRYYSLLFIYNCMFEKKYIYILFTS